jgi:hypothetical protein
VVRQDPIVPQFPEREALGLHAEAFSHSETLRRSV